MMQIISLLSRAKSGSQRASQQTLPIYQLTPVALIPTQTAVLQYIYGTVRLLLSPIVQEGGTEGRKERGRERGREGRREIGNKGDRKGVREITLLAQFPIVIRASISTCLQPIQMGE